jgi:anti-anti-sigma factor
MLENNALSFAVSDGEKEGTKIVTLEGPLTLGSLFPVQAELRTLKPACMIIDLTQVPYMDSAGLGVIMNSFISAVGGGRKFFLVGVNERIQALLEMTKVETILQTCDSMQTAQALA